MKGQIYPTKYGFQVRFGRKLTKHFKTMQEAERFLTGIRFKTDEGSFDLRDYLQSNPLCLAAQVEKFLHSKRHLKSAKKYELRLTPWIERFGQLNVKEIRFAQIQDTISELQDAGKSSKYRKDIVDTLRCLYRWMVDRDEIRIDQMPKFPKVSFSMRLRKVVSKEDQERILQELRRISFHINPRIFYAALFLTTYINLRPNELRSIKEADLDLHNGLIVIPHPKEGKPKIVYLLDEDIETLKGLPRGMPWMHIFRHEAGNGGAEPGGPFGPDYLWRWWKQACANLGIEGVSIYPGTRHSSAIAMRETTSPEAVKRATGHRTNAAFERYLQVTGSELRELYGKLRSNQPLNNTRQKATTRKLS
jgi:integrase